MEKIKINIQLMCLITVSFLLGVKGDPKEPLIGTHLSKK